MTSWRPLFISKCHVIFLLAWLATSSAATDKEVNALLEMRHSFIDINGTINDWSPLNVGNVCGWTGVTCNENGNIMKIDLTQKGLAGLVTTQIADLEHLEDLKLNLNGGLTGNLPNVMGLSRLKTIRMELNGFNGGFYFHDPYNWMSPLGRSLEEIWVDENMLSGTVDSADPSIFASSPIRVLRYGKQQFHGTIPSGYEGFPDLEDLRIGFNPFYGTIPEAWEDLTKLKNVYLPNMPNVCGPKPDFPSDPFLTFVGTPLDTACPVPPAYHQEEVDVLLDLKAALLPPSGVLDSWSADTKDDLCTGSWTGVTCDEYNYVTAIRLDNLGMEGNIHKDVHKLGVLRELSLMNNTLSGPLPSLSRLRVQYLRLSGNRLNGTIPVYHVTFWETRLAASLRELWLDNNNFTGGFSGGPPSTFWRTPLHDLRLSKNKLTGTLPEGIEGFLRLGTLHLGDNNFMGTLPTGWSNMRNASDLSIANLPLVCGILPAFPGNSFVDRNGTNIGKDCMDSVTTDTEEMVVAKRQIFVDFVSQAHKDAIQISGLDPVNKEPDSEGSGDVRNKVVIIAVGGFGSFAVAALISIAMYAKLMAPTTPRSPSLSP